MTSRLYIYEWLNPPVSNNRYRIVETYNCVDGMRSRLTEHSFATFAQAEKFISDYSMNVSKNAPVKVGE